MKSECSLDNALFSQLACMCMLYKRAHVSFINVAVSFLGPLAKYKVYLLCNL